VITGIERERELLTDVKKKANFIIDTSSTLTRQLKETVNEIVIKQKKFNSLMITVLSFGFKYGIPGDSDLVFDVRFMPNPFYLPELKKLTGLDAQVRDYVCLSEAGKAFMEKWFDMIAFLVPNYVNEGKNHLVISVGCTGGKHRSVALAEALRQFLQSQGLTVSISHRDIDKDDKALYQ
jgi:UPF0042 nucleotide-binding protein